MSQEREEQREKQEDVLASFNETMKAALEDEGFTISEQDRDADDKSLFQDATGVARYVAVVDFENGNTLRVAYTPLTYLSQIQISARFTVIPGKDSSESFEEAVGNDKTINEFSGSLANYYTAAKHNVKISKLTPQQITERDLLIKRILASLKHTQ